MIAEALRAWCVAVGLFLLMLGVALFLAGLLPGKSAPWWKQYTLSAFALTGAFYLLSYALRA